MCSKEFATFKTTLIVDKKLLLIFGEFGNKTVWCGRSSTATIACWNIGFSGQFGECGIIMAGITTGLHHCFDPLAFHSEEFIEAPYIFQPHLKVGDGIDFVMMATNFQIGRNVGLQLIMQFLRIEVGWHVNKKCILGLHADSERPEGLIAL